jgi:hypothetical protein
MKAFYIDPNGVVKYIADCPKKPKFVDTMEYVENCLNDKAKREYQQQLQAAKDSAVEFAEYLSMHDLIASLYPKQAINSTILCAPGIYPIPERYEVEMRKACNCGEHLCSHFKQVAVITPLQKEEAKKLPLNFWARLYSFVENVQANDMPGEEEKEMILNVANRFKTLYQRI